MKLLRIITAVFAGLLLLSPGRMEAYAEVSLPDGLVQGLPEKLAVLDSDGRSPDADGAYLVDIEDMAFGETYTKKIQIMNLRDDASYHIYFGAQPLDTSGEIDLEDSCVCTIELDGKLLYEGSVTGKGNVDMSAIPLDLGSYAPGSSGTLTYSVTWNKMDVSALVDNGHTLYDTNGKTVLRAPSGDGTVSGEVRFKWLFYAETEKQDDPLIPSSNPLTGDSNWFLVCVILFIIVFAFVIVMLSRKSKREQNPQDGN